MVRLFVVALVVAGVAAIAYRHFSSEPPPQAPVARQESANSRPGSVTMSDASLRAAEIGLETAGPGVIRPSLQLNGVVQPNQETMVDVTPRFAGVVREVRKRIGDLVRQGDVLAIVDSNQSLTSYELKAPIAGTVIDRQTTLGEYVSEQKPAFVVADLSSVWVDLAVYRNDLGKVRLGDKLLVDPEDGGPPIESQITYISPIGASETQSAVARAVMSSSQSRLRPGLFVKSRAILAERPVKLAVKLVALQKLQDRNVIFVRTADKFEAREVALGGRDDEQVEVVFGLSEGDVYAARNSFIVKSELVKTAEQGD
jgi:multidrug efflux pump subunit AcrA (membrane-fusion protein)